MANNNKKNNSKKAIEVHKSKLSNNEEMIKELKKTAKNVKDELSKAKDVISDNFKNNTVSFQEKVNEVKDNVSKKVLDGKDKILKEIKKINNDTDKNSSKESTETEKIDTKEKNNEFANKIHNYLNNVKNKIVSSYNKFKKLGRKTILICLIVVIFSIVVIPNIFSSKVNYKYDYDYVDKIVLKYKVKVHIEFEENLIFSRYNVDFSSPDKLETLTHGKNVDIDLILEEGKHTLTFTSEDDSEIYKEVTINVLSNMEVGYKISCHWDKISVSKLYSDSDIDLVENEIKMNSDKSSFVGKKYDEVVKSFKELGFINIIEKPKYDLKKTDDASSKVEKVEVVKINSKDSFKRGDIFNANDEVEIVYHLYIMDDPSKITPPYGSFTAEIQEMNYKDVEKAFKEAGFTNVTVEKDEVYGFFGEKENAVSSISINGNLYEYNDSAFLPTDQVKIKYYVIKGSSLSEDELGYGFAKGAFEKYGKSKYPYGFKCHWIMNLIASEQRDDGSWYFKVGVTITNQYNAKIETIAEGIVSGSNANPKVTQFYVSN